MRSDLCRTLAFVASSAVALAACDSSERGPDLSGSWQGNLAGTCAPVISLTITASSGGVLSGTANLFTPPSCGLGSLDYSVSGEHDHPAVMMTLEPEPGQGVSANRTLAGNVSGADSIVATLDGTSVTLVRQ